MELVNVLKTMHTKVNRGFFRDRMDLNISYLIELDSKWLLQNF